MRRVIGFIASAALLAAGALLGSCFGGFAAFAVPATVAAVGFYVFSYRRAHRLPFRVPNIAAIGGLALILTALSYAAAWAQSSVADLPPPSFSLLAEYLYLHKADLFAMVAQLSLLASAFVAATRTPDPNTPWGRVYQLIELLALVVGKAKQVAPQLAGATGGGSVAIRIDNAPAGGNPPAPAPSATPAATAMVVLLIGAAGLGLTSLTGCTSTGTPDPAAVSKDWEIGCMGLKAAEAVFQGLVIDGVVDAAGQAEEAQIAAGLDATCAGAPPQDIPTAVQELSLGAERITAIVAAARSASPPAAGAPASAPATAAAPPAT